MRILNNFRWYRQLRGGLWTLLNIVDMPSDRPYKLFPDDITRWKHESYNETRKYWIVKSEDYRVYPPKIFCTFPDKSK